MLNRTRIRVGYNPPYDGLYYGVNVMLMGFDVEMANMHVAERVGHKTNDQDFKLFYFYIN